VKITSGEEGPQPAAADRRILGESAYRGRVTDIAIRPLARADRSEWEPLWAGYNQVYERSGPTAVPPEQTELTFTRFLDPIEPMHALVAELDGELVGLAHYLFHRNTITTNPICYLQDLFTDASARGRGVGRALIGAVYDAAREAGSSRVYWQTHHTNATARALYDTVADDSGFVVYRHDLQG
jgi:GNAT superfamily N-acetyltransferase